MLTPEKIDSIRVLSTLPRSDTTLGKGHLVCTSSEDALRIITALGTASHRNPYYRDALLALYTWVERDRQALKDTYEGVANLLLDAAQRVGEAARKQNP